MATRTVRLDNESERLLDDLQRETGESVSTLLKRGLVALSDATRSQAGRAPFSIYAELDLGPGGYALAPSRLSKQSIKSVLQAKRSRK
jgi:hypothetical protein